MGGATRPQFDDRQSRTFARVELAFPDRVSVMMKSSEIIGRTIRRS